MHPLHTTIVRQWHKLLHLKLTYVLEPRTNHPSYISIQGKFDWNKCPEKDMLQAMEKEGKASGKWEGKRLCCQYGTESLVSLCKWECGIYIQEKYICFLKFFFFLIFLLPTPPPSPTLGSSKYLAAVSAWMRGLNHCDLLCHRKRFTSIRCINMHLYPSVLQMEALVLHTWRTRLCLKIGERGKNWHFA